MFTFLVHSKKSTGENALFYSEYLIVPAPSVAPAPLLLIVPEVLGRGHHGGVLLRVRGERLQLVRAVQGSVPPHLLELLEVRKLSASSPAPSAAVALAPHVVPPTGAEVAVGVQTGA